MKKICSKPIPWLFCGWAAGTKASHTVVIFWLGEIFDSTYFERNCASAASQSPGYFVVGRRLGIHGAPAPVFRFECDCAFVLQSYFMKMFEFYPIEELLPGWCMLCGVIKNKTNISNHKVLCWVGFDCGYFTGSFLISSLFTFLDILYNDNRIISQNCS